jgi:hypothetical protein
MTLNLDEMIKVITHANAILAGLCMEANQAHKVKRYEPGIRLLLPQMHQVSEQLEMLRDMFHPTFPDEDED